MNRWFGAAAALALGGAGPVTQHGNYQLSYPFPSADGATLVFQGNFDGRWQLYEMKSADGSIRRLHSSARDDTHPALSPDGKRLAFISNRGGNDDVWMLDLATGEARAVAPHPGKDGHPKWSPDGQWLVFNRTFDPADADGDRDSAIMVVKPDGSGLHVVSDSPRVETFPSFSPDGRSVAFIEWTSTEGADRNADLVVVDRATKRRQKLTDSPEFDAYPYWASSGWIYYSTVREGPRGREAVLMRIKPGQPPQQLGEIDGASEMRAIPASDGKSVWFNRADGGRGLIFRMGLPQVDQR